jgi:type VI secretion system protein ImpM
MGMMEIEQRLGWYGKIPAAGDFVNRNLPRDLSAWWDKWLQHGLAALKQSQDEAAARAFAAAPLWNFAIPSGPGAGAVQFGCIAASRDRVGRLYPLCVSLYLPVGTYEPRMLDTAGEYFHQAGVGLLMAVRHGCAADQLERALQPARAAAVAMTTVTVGAASSASSRGSDIMDILNAGQPAPAQAIAGKRALAWAELPSVFNPGSHTSYWWTNQADGAALRTYVHGGALNATLFATLFSSYAGVRR